MAEVDAKFRDGDILVVPYTSNALMDTIRRSAAVISEESGVNSHAATVGLALNKPVLVGAVNATRILKDGVLVAVDCGRGAVQMLPQ